MSDGVLEQLMATSIPDLPDKDWEARGHCLEDDREKYFPDPEKEEQVSLEVRQTCLECPVQPSCLRWALEHQPDDDFKSGIFGGLIGSERRRFRKRLVRHNIYVYRGLGLTYGQTDDKMGAEVDMSDVKIELNHKWRSGFCTMGNNDRCPQVVLNGNGVWLACIDDYHTVVDGAPISQEDHRRHLLDHVIPARVDMIEKIQAQQKDRNVHTKTGRRRPGTGAASKQTKDCLCGCGDKTKGGKFKPGHDSKLKARLIDVVCDNDRALSERQQALDRLDELGWSKFVSDTIRGDLKGE